MLLENFNTGILSEPGELPPNTFALKNVENLRPNTDGHLIPRPRVEESLFAALSAKIEGVAQKGNLLFIVANDRLYMSVDGDTPVQVSGVTDVKGRISIADQYDSFVVIKTENGDPSNVLNIHGLPYWVDISDETAPAGHRLGLPAPIPTSLNFTLTRYTPAAAALSEGAWYGYRFTFANDETHDSTTGIKDPFTGIDSPPSTIETLEMQIGNHQGVRITHSVPSISDVTKTRIWRSKGYASADKINNDIEFRLVGEIESGSTSFDDDVTDTDWAENDLLDKQNNNFPSTADSITYYNGLLFAPNITELRYNDRRLGISELHLWPEANQLKYPATWAVEYQGYLYFGDKDNTYALSGTGEGIPPFQVRRVDSIGALNQYCAAITSFGLTIISDTGMWASQGSGFTKMSTGLDEVFRDLQIIGGSMLQLPDRTVLFNVHLNDDTQKQYLASSVSGAVVFFAWSGVDMLQGVEIQTNDAIITANGAAWEAGGDEWVFETDFDKITRVIIATEGATRLSDLEWNREGPYSEDATWRIESNDVFQSQTKAQMAKKRYRRLIFNAEGSGDVTAVFQVDGTRFQKTATLRQGKPTRIPIRRRGNKMNFELYGQGDIEARGLLLEYEPLRNY